jgi:hypothetical protein
MVFMYIKSNAKNHIFILQLSYNASLSVPTNLWNRSLLKKKKKKNGTIVWDDTPIYGIVVRLMLNITLPISVG